MMNMWKSGIMGVVVGDALGCPIQFETRAQVAKNPVKGMIGYRTFNLPEGSWTDDSSLTLALVKSIMRTDGIHLSDIMNRFVRWLEEGEYTPYGFSYDIGRGTMEAIKSYEACHDPHLCGGKSASNNGNGSLMRIMPAILYCIQNNYPDYQAVFTVHSVSALTHAHVRAKIACGLYYFMANSIINGDGSLLDRLQAGLDVGFAYYEDMNYDQTELAYFHRLRDLRQFKDTGAERIKSSGYVVDTLEAAVWGLITTSSFEEALLKLVNLGGDTDSIAAVAGGLAGLYYGYDAIPADWLAVIKRREWIERMLNNLDEGGYINNEANRR